MDGVNTLNKIPKLFNYVHLVILVTDRVSSSYVQEITSMYRGLFVNIRRFTVYDMSHDFYVSIYFAKGLQSL